ncbi:hypothetical protein JYU34_022451 [Plutella xylostella]|uniref:ARHGEF1-like PH domain-containing protein n=1 Tax=Plutella xylostella TaxID=51655 RepID=A0ABQ7PQY8_PLUXY|nr:hypothetical protein JYU34_022451 [Plutella xylostella]
MQQYMARLMLEDILVLLQREGDKFVLKPVTQPSQQGLLSPLIRWDKVLFRPNAAVRNAFFLMNINGVQMHELSTNTSTEYTTWVKHIQDAPLAKLTDLKPHQPRQSEDSGTNVSRNPSDASEKSEKSEKSDKLDKTDIPSPLQPEDTSTPERQLSRERSEERERERAKSVEDSRGREGGSEERERERHTSPRRPTVGRISTVARSPPPLEQVLVAPPLAHTCHVPVTEYTSDERLRRLDRLIASALAAKASIVGALLDAPAGAMTHLADIARADTLCDTDIASELRATRLDRSSSVEEDMPEPDVDNIHPLLLTAYAQATELTETLSGALRVSPARLMRARRGRCDQCAPQHEPPPPPAEQPITDVDQSAESLGTSKDASFDMLSELANMEGERSFIDPDDSASALATRLLPVSAGLQAALSRLLVAAPLAAQRHVATRSQLTAASEYQCRLRTSKTNPVTGVDDLDETDETRPGDREATLNH